MIYVSIAINSSIYNKLTPTFYPRFIFIGQVVYDSINNSNFKCTIRVQRRNAQYILNSKIWQVLYEIFFLKTTYGVRLCEF